MTTRGPTGLLLATMEPPANLEEEFQDWYDSEHFPERATCSGFLTAHRFTCIDGWPRYLAMYDLDDVEVLRGEAYARIAHGRYSPWTHRIMARVWGQYRAEGVQVYPGDGLHGGRGASSRLVLWRFRGVAGDGEPRLVSALREHHEGHPHTVQLRVFRVTGATPGDYLAMVELSMPLMAGDQPCAPAAGVQVDLVNTYVAYVRQAPGAFPKASP